MRTFLADLWFGVRLFARTPAFTSVAVVSLALGIGANTAIFSVASALLLRPLSYADAERLVILWNRSPGLGIVEDWFSTAQFFDIRDSAESFEEVALAIGSNVNLTGEGAPERVGMIRVSSNLLPMLGARPADGRLFTPDDDVEGASPAVVLQHRTWMRRFGGDPSAVGRHVILNGTSHQIVGVLPRGFSLSREVMPTLGVVADAEVFASLPLPANAPQIRGREDYNILAKLRPATTVEGAQAEMDRLTARLRQDHPGIYPPNGGLALVLRHGLTAVLLGVGVGLISAAGAVQFMHRLLFGVDPLDPVTFGGVALTLVVIARAATALPAARAARVDPSVSLRAD